MKCAQSHCSEPLMRIMSHVMRALDRIGKRNLRTICPAACKVAFVLFLLFPGVIYSDIGKTKHNLSKSAVDGSKGQDTNEICIFCHAPRLQISVGSSKVAPLWYPSLIRFEPFQIYDHIGRADMDDSVPVGSQSFACLSCHDGSQALSITKLTFDHPYGVPYRGRFAAETIPSPAKKTLRSHEPFKAAQSQLFLDFRPAASGVVDNRKVWWVPTGPPSGIRGKDDIPLYARSGDPSGEAVPYIECTSCHDPHTEHAAFLRISNEGSRLCLSCHDM